MVIFSRIATHWKNKTPSGQFSHTFWDLGQNPLPESGRPEQTCMARVGLSKLGDKGVQCQNRHLRAKCCLTRRLMAQTDLSSPVWEQKRANSFKNRSKQVKYSSTEAFEARFSIYARNAAWCDGEWCKRTSVDPFGGKKVPASQKIAQNWWKSSKAGHHRRFRGQIQYLRAKCCIMRWWMVQTDTCRPIWGQKGANKSENSPKLMIK